MPWFCCLVPMPDSDQLVINNDPLAGLPFAHGGAPLTGVLRAAPEDFRVEEVLGFPLSGEGKHLVLKVCKRGLNTMHVVQRLARWADVVPMTIGFAGLKDRHAVAVQHFSVPLPEVGMPDMALLEDEGLAVTALNRHHSKLQRGELKGNRFSLRLTALQGDEQVAEQCLRVLREQGFPNYFGPQRFGRGASNLVQAQSLLCGRLADPKPEQRRMLLSAARSHVFNQVLAARVRNHSWQQVLQGDVLLLEESGRQLIATVATRQIQARVRAGELAPSGPLPGRSGHCLAAEGEAAAVETAAIREQHLQPWCEALAHRGQDAARRALGARARGLAWQWEGRHTLALQFELSAGCYATSLVRELMSAARLA